MQMTSEQEIRRSKTYELIAERLVGEIVEGGLTVGDPIPTERELVERFGVGRSSVREGLRMLEAHRVIIPGGSGIYRVGARNAVMVAALQMLVSLGEANLEDIHLVRRTLEIEAAGLAARHRTAEDLDGIRATLRAMIKNRSNPRVALEADLDFHVAMAQASKNGALVASILGLRTVLSKNLEDRTFDIDDAIDQHQLIVEAVVAHDEEGAREAVRQHMDWIAAT